MKTPSVFFGMRVPHPNVAICATLGWDSMSAGGCPRTCPELVEGARDFRDPGFHAASSLKNFVGKRQRVFAIFSSHKSRDRSPLT